MLAQAEGDHAKSQLALTQHKIESPVDGVILEQSIRGVGDVVKASQPLFSIVPKEDGLIAELRVTNRDLAYLHTRQRVAMRLDALPYTVWGRLHGTILSISPSTHLPSSPSNTPTATIPAAQQPYYTIRVKPEQLFMTSRHGRTEPLRSGMTLSADIITRKKSLWSFFLEPIQGQVDAAFREPSTR